jgi:hypothetical protein
VASEDDGPAEPDPPAEPRDPGTDLHDPGESVRVPSIDLPEVPEVTPPSTDGSDAPPELAQAFWILVLVVNGAVLATALGAMFVVFESDWDLGGRLLFAGGVLGVYGYYRYRNFPDPSEVADGADGADDGSEADGDDGASGVDGGETGTADGDPVGGTAGGGGSPAGTVEDGAGNRYVLVKRSSEASLVRDPSTGESEHFPNDELTTVEGSALTAAAEGVPAATRRVLSATHDDRSLGLLLELVDRGSVSARALLSDYDLCESDLHGLLGEFRAAGLVEETTVAGQRGYRATDLAEEGVAGLRATGPA